MTDLDALRALVAKVVHALQAQPIRTHWDGCEEHHPYCMVAQLTKNLPALLDELASARRDAEDIRRAGEILADAPGLPLELLDEKELSKWTDAITGLVILFTDAIDAARGER